MNKEKLCEFLCKAKKGTYAAGNGVNKIIEADKSTSLFFQEGNLKYHDNYFGGEPFGGREVVFEQGEPIYLMAYYGLVDKSVSDFEPIYGFLQKALSLIPNDYPFRGPDEYSEGDLVYINKHIGEIDDFSGEEIITKNGQEIFRTKYIGGFVNQRK